MDDIQIRDGRRYRRVVIEAADTREAGRHIMAQRPESAYSQRVARREVKRTRP
jgi:hypothetical protein